MLNIKDITNLILTVTFVATFIGIFFFTYAAKVEKEIVIKQVQYITADMTSILRTNLDNDYKNKIKNVLSTAKPPNMDKIDEEVNESNKELMKKAFTILGIIFVAGVAATYYLSKQYNLDFGDILMKNLVMLGFIGIVEFVFITFFAKQFISADPNYVRLAIINTLREFSNE